MESNLYIYKLFHEGMLYTYLKYIITSSELWMPLDTVQTVQSILKYLISPLQFAISIALLLNYIRIKKSTKCRNQGGRRRE
jgi:hypothetical protein